jgi:CheY-like chemotaxis protein
MKTVLTVDDSKVVRALIARNLGDYGVQVVEAENGRDGLAAARLHKPALILLDVTMPVMGGVEVLAALRNDETTRSIPVIMLAAEGGEDPLVELVRLGIAGYIVKPFQQATFDAEVSKVLGPPGAAAAGPDGVGVDDTEHALTSARQAVAAADDVLRGLLEEVNGCTIFTLPDTSTALARAVPAFTGKLHALKNAGRDRIVFDLVPTAHVTAEQVSSLVRVIVEAKALGMRTAVCSRDEMVMANLRGWVGTHGMVCATTRDRALEQLR